MSSPVPGKPLFLCGAPQSSGSSLMSWCFLQRPDTDGVLDARNDHLPEMPPIATPYAWCKYTIASFRLHEVAEHLTDEGWDVRPLLFTRDPRAVFNSLITKSYGRNSITAEEPPLRMRLRRVHQDWADARKHGWPVIRYETFVADAEATMRTACEQLKLPWDDAMLTWPKSREQIAAPGHGSPTFRSSRGGSLTDTLRGELNELKTKNIPADDLRWMEDEFAEMLRDLDYPPHADSQQCVPGRAVPTFDQSRRAMRARRPLTRFRNAVRGVLRQIRGKTNPTNASQ